MNISYAIVGPDSVLTDGLVTNVLYLNDLPSDSINWRSEALAASGDFCETLAAKLEEIVGILPKTSVEHHQMEDAIDQLLYMQRHYKLVRKTAR